MVDNGANGKMQFVYNAAGQKLRTTLYDSPSNITDTSDYIGNFIYKNGQLSYILMPEGRILPNGSSFTYEYHLEDHLGNTRATYIAGANGNTTLTQTTAYYPFGLPINALSRNLENNPYLYNGKELHSELNLDLFDYGARFYDPVLGRFHTIDRFAEKYVSLTPYQYGANSPINFIDVNGDSLWIYYGKSEENMQRVEYRNGNLYNKEGKKYENFDFGQDGGQYVALCLMALRKIQNGGDAGSNLIGSLQEEGFNANIYYGENSAENNEANWNPFQQGKVLTTEGVEKPKSYIGLAHELAHIDDYKKGTIDLSEWYKSGEQIVTNSEKYATHIENKIRAENKEAIRTYYGSTIDKSGKINGGTGQITNGRISIYYKTEY